MNTLGDEGICASKKQYIAIGILKIVQSPEERPHGAGRFWEELYDCYSYKVKKEGELGDGSQQLQLLDKVISNTFLSGSLTGRCLERGTVQGRSHALLWGEIISHDNKINSGDTRFESQ